MMTKACKVSFITVNYNGKEDTIALLRSIYEASLSFSFEVIVIDNASRSDEFVLLKQAYPDIKGMRSAENLGFAGGNNLGIQMSTGEYLYFLNNDTVLPEKADAQIRAMLTFCAENSQVGGISPKILYFEPRNLLQFVGSTPLSKITLRNRQIGYRETDQGQYEEIRQIPYMHGAAMLVPRYVIEDGGMMSELFFLYYEELDWSCRITEKYKLYYFPFAYIFHKESATTGIESPLKTFYLTRNRMLFADRNRRGLIRILSLLYLVCIANTLKMFKFMTKGQWQQILSVWHGTWSAFKLFNSK